MKRKAHITIGGQPFCEWTGCQAGRDAQLAAATRDPGAVTVCGHASHASANRLARALRPQFKTGSVKVVSGVCPHDAEARS